MIYFKVILNIFDISDVGTPNSSVLRSHSIKSSDVNLWRHTSFKVYTRLKKDCFSVFIPNQNWATCFLIVHTCTRLAYYLRSQIFLLYVELRCDFLERNQTFTKREQKLKRVVLLSVLWKSKTSLDDTSILRYKVKVPSLSFKGIKLIGTVYRGRDHLITLLNSR